MPIVLEKRKTQSIKIKPSIHKIAKIAAIENDMTFSELVEQALDHWLKEHKAR